MANAEDSRRHILVSIRPEFAEKIAQGLKTVELRRRFAQQVRPSTLALIYSTRPTQAIIGYATIAAVKRMKVARIWRKFGRAACISRIDFERYFDGADDGYAILLQKFTRLDQVLALCVLKERFGFVPPQSFMYLPKKYHVLFDDERLQASY